MPTFTRRLNTLCALIPLLAGGPRTALAQEAVWYPASEPSAFLPDDARWIGQVPEAGQGWSRPLYLRGTWQTRGPVRRAVLMTAPMQTVRLYAEGRLALTGHDEREALPGWTESSGWLGEGDVFMAAMVHSEWRPVLYAQLRVEYEDGSWEDLVTGDGWECATNPGGDWASNPDSAGDWRPVADAGGYYREQGDGIWGREFALLPREMLRQRFGAHNARLRTGFLSSDGPGPLRITEAPERDEWARQFAGFCRVDEETGQLLDGAGRVRHLFFTIYNQQRDGGAVLHVPGFDLDQLERDLDLMAQADVHLYMRQTGWDWLLTQDGEWAPLAEQPTGTDLPHFARGIDLLDHFVRRAHAHGRYIVFEGDFYWGAHRDVVPAPYRSRYHLYPEVLEAQALAMRKIMAHLSACSNVLGMMIGEEDIVLAHDLANPHQHALFADFLQRKYGSLEAFAAQTPRAYEYADTSQYALRERKPEYWPSVEREEVLVPRLPLQDGLFDRLRAWTDVPLPLWPSFRSPVDPEVALGGHKSYNEFTPADPLWIDFYETREDELLFGMLARWVEIVREGMPDQLLFYSNAQDFTNSWHFLHLFRRADLPFDVIGVGCHDSETNLADLPPWATVRKAIKVVSSYRPYALAPGSPPRGIASGEGEGGRHEQPEEVLNYYRGALFDEIGGGAAWTQTYTWAHVSGADNTGTPHDTPLLQWFGEFMPAVQGVRFPLRRPVQVLIVRNTNLQHSNMSGLDYGNVRSVAETLTQLNIEFDIVMDRDVAHGETPLKVALSPYRLVILPTVWADHPPAVWDALGQWLSDSGPQGARVLAVGRVGPFGPHLEPRDGFPAALAAWTGVDGYVGETTLRGPQELRLHGEPEEALAMDFGSTPPTGIVSGATPFLSTAGGEVIGSCFAYGGNEVVHCGFPLGLAGNELWGLEPTQDPRDALAPIFEELIKRAGVDRPILAPHNLRVYVSEGAEMLLIRERAGLPTDAEVAIRASGNLRYSGLGTSRTEDGYMRFQVRLEPWEGRYWKSAR